jgi:tripartite-type tricarboxylate transporter receptor subunit TctC
MMTITISRHLITGVTLGPTLVAMCAAAAAPVLREYSVKAIRLIVPEAPGSPPDLAARIIGSPLADALGQPVIMDNRPGASGTISGA